MSLSDDLYALLGVKPSASADAVRQAYRQLARRYHPDVNDSEETAELFKRITRAYNVLSDPGHRKLYDEFGADSLRRNFDPQKARRRRDAPPTVSANDLFSRRTTRTTRRTGPMPPTGDLELALEIDFGLAVKGGSLQLRAPHTGSMLTVHVPPGVTAGQRLRLVGKGNPRPGGAGDLYLSLTPRTHRYYRRDGDDLRLTLPISIGEAFGGASIRVPGPAGDLRVDIPRGSRGGEEIRLPGKGLARDTGGCGDLVVELSVRLPERIDGRVLRQLPTEYGDRLRHDLKL